MRSRRLAYCRGCEKETAQKWVGAENGNRPQTLYFACEDCGLVLITYADLLDAEGLCISVLDRYVRTNGLRDYGDVRSVDRDEAVGELRVALWKAYTEWDPARCLRFRAYASQILSQRLIDFFRRRPSAGGGDDPRLAAVTDSLDALVGSRSDDDGDPVGSLVGSSEGDPSQGRTPDLARALSARGRRADRSEPSGDRTRGARPTTRPGGRASEEAVGRGADAGVAA